MAAVWHPFTQVKTAFPPIEIKKGKGSYIVSGDGTKYLDAISSWWVNLHGHSHPYIAKKIAEQSLELEHVIFADFTHKPAINLANRLLELLPDHMTKIFYSDNGSTAVEVALKMALQYWHNKGIKKHKIIAYKDGYHGDTFGSMSLAGKSLFNKPFWNHLFEVISITPPLPGFEKQSLEELKVALSSRNVACFLFEPLVMGVSGMRMYSANHLDQLLRICQKEDVITIADEVMTGFGRTGPLFACDYLQEKPDIMCLSKGITGGFLPMGATACTQKIYEAFLSKKTHKAFLHGHSYTGNPLACASALASLDLLLKPFCQSQRAMITKSHEAFIKKWHSHSRLKRCESLGTILSIEYEESNPSYFSSLRNSLYTFFLKKNLLLRPLGNVVYVLPPYCITQSELNYIYETIALTF